MFAGVLGRLGVNGAGHIQLLTNAEFNAKFVPEQSDATVPVDYFVVVY